MFKDQNRELQRLEEALLQEEENDPILDEDLIEEDEQEDELLLQNYSFYNSDTADVDLDDYSDEVYNAKPRTSPLVALALCLATAILLLVLYLILWRGGYL